MGESSEMGERRHSPAYGYTKLFPAGWESAIAELECDGRVFGCVSLSGVDGSAEGAARTRTAKPVIEFYGPEGTGEWTFDYDLEQVLEVIALAQEWVVENEQGRAPTTEGPVSAAGAAFSTMSEKTQLEWRKRSAGAD